MVCVLPLTPVAGEEAGRHRDLEAVTRQELLSGRAVSPSRVLLSSLSSLVSLEMRGDLETGLCGGPGGARGLCFSLVLLWCPEDKGEKKTSLRNCRCCVRDVRLKILGAVQIPLWRNFSFLFLSCLKVKAALKSKSLSNNLYCQDFGKTTTLTRYGCDNLVVVSMKVM